MESLMLSAMKEVITIAHVYLCLSLHLNWLLCSFNCHLLKITTLLS